MIGLETLRSDCHDSLLWRPFLIVLVERNKSLPIDVHVDHEPARFFRPAGQGLGEGDNLAVRQAFDKVTTAAATAIAKRHSVRTSGRDRRTCHSRCVNGRRDRTSMRSQDCRGNHCRKSMATNLCLEMQAKATKSANLRTRPRDRMSGLTSRDQKAGTIDGCDERQSLPDCLAFFAKFAQFVRFRLEHQVMLPWN